MPYTPEKEKLHRRIMDAVSSVVTYYDPPSRICFLDIEAETAKRYVALVDIERESDKVWLSNRGVVEVNGVTSTELADRLLQKYPRTPLICSREIADELARYSLTFRIDENHRLLARPKGFLEVYVR